MDAIRHFFSELSEDNFSQLRHFCELVCTKNEVLNLISRKDIDRIVEAHLLPSLAIFKKNPFPESSKILDIGTGGGFPGIPLAIAMPSAHFTVIDSIGKKIKAVSEFVSALGLKNVTCISDRVENLRKKYHHITGRAVVKVDDFRILAEPHLLPGGKIFYLSGGTIVPRKNVEVIDLHTLYGRQFCETKKLLILRSHGA
ncbi:MAG: 16S rRNA (guanine(527)-N(7))-methyltransferase RsmG [Puniceicoccales bacterium]|nr:16S rRNA (guanine(527)-N(7))-methyltransferase RsmG [Puniceicoccales bacterium]